jgi:carbohydrate kinase (thermoresistant glucokinase family)
MMGVSGSSKSTIPRRSLRLGSAFEESEALHPKRVSPRCIRLTDDDRKPWLQVVAAWIDGQRAAGTPGIITCSAPKRAYRRIVIADRPEARLV